MPGELTLQFAKPVASLPAGPVVFAIVRDEDYLLPFFFDHYRALGIEGFLIYDDRSAAPTVEFLKAQQHCVIARSEHRFGDSFGLNPPENTPRRLGQVLKMSLPEALLAGRWVLTVDADEFLILPPGVDSLTQLVERLDAVDQPYLTAPMVEFYGETLASRNYPRSLSPFDGAPFFDVGPYYDWSDIVPKHLVGGVRERLMRRLAERAPAEFSRIYADHPPYPVKTWKTPLLKHGRGVTRINNHELSVLPRTAIAGALAHFKFGPDLDGKIETAVREGQYYHRSLEYRLLAAAIRALGDEPLASPETRRWQGPQSLVDAGLLPPVRT